MSTSEDLINELTQKDVGQSPSEQRQKPRERMRDLNARKESVERI